MRSILLVGFNLAQLYYLIMYLFEAPKVAFLCVCVRNLLWADSEKFNDAVLQKVKKLLCLKSNNVITLE